MNWLLIALAAANAEPLPVGPPPRELTVVPKMERLMTTADAHAAALRDALEFAEGDRIFLRYVWCPLLDGNRVKSVNFAKNAVSSSSVILPPNDFAGGHLMRVDLRSMANRVGDTSVVQRYIDTWEKLQFDPAFSRNFLSDDILVFTGKSEDEVPHCRVRGDDGYESVAVTDARFKGLDVVRVDAPNLDSTTTEALQDAVQSLAPVVSSDYFIWRSLTTIQDDGPWKVIYGGLYYEFNGIKTTSADAKSKDKDDDKKKTDQQVFLESIGIADDDIARTNQGELRGIQMSDVTGSRRQWRILWGRNTNPKVGIPLVGITGDIRTKSIGNKQNVILNLVTFDDDARELLYVKANGMLGQVLFNNKGKRQDEVPFDVANNHEIPSPHVKRLEGIIGCYDCHMRRGSDGWIPLKNEVTDLRRSLDIFGDAGRKNALLADTVNEIAGLYTGSPDTALRRAREDQQAVTLEVTGGFGKDPLLDVAKTATSSMVSLYHKHRYDLVTPQQAMRECGWHVADKDAATATFRAMTKLPVGEVENATVGLLQSGVAIPRVEFDFVKTVLAVRIRSAADKMPPEDKK